MRFILETYVRKISPYQGEGMICSSSFGVWVTGLWWGKRKSFLFCFILDFISVCTRWSPNRTMCFTLKIRLSPLRARNAHRTGKVLLSNVYITGKSLWGKRRSTFVSMLLHLTFSWKPSTCAVFFLVFFGGWVGVLRQKYITAAALSRDWTTGFMWREVWSSCNRLFLFAYATPICSTHSNAMPSQNLLT